MPQNVVLICLDTVRYDYLQQYGDDLTKLSDLSFEQCRSASTWSVPSHASMFTGQLPHRHGFHSPTPEFGELATEDTFLSELDGFRHVGVSANPYASPIFWFDRIFDDFYHITSSMPYDSGLSPSEFWHESASSGWKRYFQFLRACLEHDHPGRSLANGVASQTEELFRSLPLAKPFDGGCKRILNRIERELSEASQPTFVFANIMDVHGPLTNVRGYDQSLISESNRRVTPDLDALSMNLDASYDQHQAAIDAYREFYAAAVDYTSRKVAEFCESLENTTVIVTSDHGEQLADDGGERRFGHVTPDMTESLLHVPLEIINTDVDIEETQLLSHLDLGELVTAIATGQEFERDRPIAAEVAGLGVAHPPTEHERFEYWNRTSRCVYVKDSKYVWDSCGSGRVFRKDDGEYQLENEGDLGLVPMEATSKFGIDISDVRRNTTSENLDEGVKSQLEELGYL